MLTDSWADLSRSGTSTWWTSARRSGKNIDFWMDVNGVDDPRDALHVLAGPGGAATHAGADTDARALADATPAATGTHAAADAHAAADLAAKTDSELSVKRRWLQGAGFRP